MNNKYKGFFVLEKIPNAPIYHFALADSTFVNLFFKNIHKLKKDPGPTLCIYDGTDFSFCYQKQALQECCQNIYEKLINNPKWGIEVDDRTIEASSNFINFCKKIENQDLSKISDEELSSIAHGWFFDYFHDTWINGWPSVLVDFDENLFSNHLLEFLKTKIKQENYDVSVGDIFSTLTTPLEETFAQKEAKSLLQILESVKTNKELLEIFNSLDSEEIWRKWKNIDEKSWGEFEKHYNNFRWLPYMYMGPAWDRKYFIESLASLVRQDTNPQEELTVLEEQQDKIKEMQEKYKNDLKIDGNEEVLFQVARKFVYSKSFRKDAQYYACFVLEKILREVARRKYLSLSQAYRIYPWEIKDFMADIGPDENVLNQRIFAVQYSTTEHHETHEGEKAREFLKNFEFIKQKIKKQSMLEGDCASVGKVRGTVKIINTPEDMQKMEEGNVLVSYATSPDIMPAIKKAVAIVTDLGGIICHAAIVSRELHIPCVVGTKIATQVLKDGDIIDVDATHGVVRIIK